FGDRAPRIVKDPPGKKGDFLQFGARNQTIGRLGIAGRRLDDPKTHELIAQGYAGMRPGVLNPAARLEDQAIDGIAGEVMYPSLNMSTFWHPDREVVHAIFCNHNDWLYDYCAYAPERLVGVAVVPLPDVEDAIKE